MKKPHWFNTQTTQDQFQLFYRTFNSSKALKLEFDCPPELNRAGGSFAVSSPKKGMFGGGSWRIGSTEVPSVVLNLVEGQLYYSLNLICAKPFETLIEVFGTNSSDECLNWPNLIEAPHATIEKESLKGAEDITIQIKEYIAGSWVKSMPVLSLDFTSSEIEAKNKGYDIYLVFVIQREDCKKFKIAEDIDPKYKKLLTFALKNKLKVICYDCKFSSKGIIINDKIKFIR